MLDLVIEGTRKDLGGGLEVGRVLPFARRRMVGPFIFLDHMGPADFRSGEGIDVRPHPHIGLATVTYLFDGEIHHRDSLGVSQKIRPGEVNWMTAGSGIVHSERTDPSLRSSGGLMHGMQAWVALPREDEEVDPAFAHHAADALPELSERGVWARLIAGSAYGLSNAVRTFSPLFYLHVELASGASIAMPADHDERAAYVVSGAVVHDGVRHAAGRLLVFRRRRRTCHRGHGRAGARDAARRREHRSALHLVEFGVLAARTHRAGKGGLEIRPDGVATGRQPRVHPVAGRSAAAAGTDASSLTGAHAASLARGRCIATLRPTTLGMEPGSCVTIFPPGVRCCSCR